MAKRPNPSGGADVTTGGQSKRVALAWASEILSENEASSLHDALRTLYGDGTSGGGQQQAQASPVVDLTGIDSDDEASDDEDGDEEHGSSGKAAASTNDLSIDDDGLEVLDNPAPALGPADTRTITLGDGEDECVVVGRSSSAIETLPHARADCVVHPLTFGARAFCDTCYCYVCDLPAPDCGSWAVHCEATHRDPFWREERTQQRQRRQSIERDASSKARVSASPAPRSTASADVPQQARAPPSDAVAYVSTVKRALAVSDPDKWKTFLAVLKRYREGGKSTSYVLEKLAPLMRGRPDLLAGLHRFIDPRSAASPKPTVAPSPPRASGTISGEV